MIELDDRLLALRGRAAEFAAAIRPHAIELDADPSAVHRHLDIPLLLRLGTLQVPPEYQPEPLRIGRHRFHLMTALERVVLSMEAARGDLGMLLAAPGAPMAGVAVAALGDERQRELFFSRVVADPTWVFFALSEPRGGSDANGMHTRLERDPGTGELTLHGTKRYIGNGARAQIGVAFAKRGNGGPLAATAVLVDATDPGFHARPIPTLGLRGAGLSEVTFDNVPIPPERVLGAHLPATRGGLWAWSRTFNLLRPVVAAMGVGVAQAAYDYVVDHCTRLSEARRDQLERLGLEIESVRQLTLHAAVEADRDAGSGELSSAAKARAATVAEKVTRFAGGCFGFSGLVEHPLLEKLLRDARGVEFMEGPGPVQRMAVFAGLDRRQAGHR